MLYSIIYGAAMATMVSAHGAIVAVQGEAGSPQGIGFQVDLALARNCTNISPCQQDTTLIRDAEISANIVNECGRTEISGNIDVGENTENQLAAGQVTQVKAGTPVTVTIHQVNADGAGPYACDLDPTGNSLGVTGQTNLTVTNNVPGVNGFSQVKTTDFNITVTMPTDLACTGGSTGNICTVRCRNNALAGPFGGCFPVQQTDTTAAVNSANTITTAQTQAGVTAQIAQNKQDLAVAIAANQNAGTPEALKAQDTVDQLIVSSIVSKASPTQTLSVENNAAAAAATTAASTTKAGKGSAKATTAASAKGNGNAKGNANAASANAATGGKATAANAKGNNNKRFTPNMKWAKRVFSEESN